MLIAKFAVIQIPYGSIKTVSESLSPGLSPPSLALATTRPLNLLPSCDVSGAERFHARTLGISLRQRSGPGHAGFDRRPAGADGCGLAPNRHSRRRSGPRHGGEPRPQGGSAYAARAERHG